MRFIYGLTIEEIKKMIEAEESRTRRRVTEVLLNEREWREFMQSLGYHENVLRSYKVPLIARPGKVLPLDQLPDPFGPLPPLVQYITIRPE